MQLESITSFIRCNVLIPLFSITESLPCPVAHECDANSTCIRDPNYPYSPYCRCKAHYEKSDDGACIGKIKFFNSAIYLKPIHPGLDKFENIVFILKLPLTFPSTPCRINFAKCNSFGDRNALHLHNGNKSIISSKIRNSDLGIFEKLHFRSELVSVDGAGVARC